MNKIICDVCGTAYPDTAHQCPICGCAKPADEHIQSGLLAEQEAEAGYTYVKGGRFSKSNVRKRNNMAKAAAMYAEDDPEEDEVPKENNRGLTIAIILLLLAIIAVSAYIYIRFFAPSGSGKTKVETTPVIATTPVVTTPESTTPPVTTPEPTTPAPTTTNLNCTGITLADQVIIFDKLGTSWQLTATVEPANTPDQIVYASADPKVATVDANGRLMAIGNGTTTITVSCGDVSTQCTVTVQVPEQDKTLRFNSSDPFYGVLTAGHGFRLKLIDANGNALEVTNWTSSKTGVATVSQDGVVSAKSEGRAIISCTYNGWEYKCTIDVKAE